jgi:phage terminase small subunit
MLGLAARIAMAQTELLVKGLTQGLPLQNPYLPIVNRQMMLLTLVASELGFTPCSRARIDAGGVPAPVGSHWDNIAIG